MENSWRDLVTRSIEYNDITQAYELMATYVRYHAQDEEGWLWLSRVTPDPNAKREYLQYVLDLNPHNSEAAQELSALVTGVKGRLVSSNQLTGNDLKVESPSIESPEHLDMPNPAGSARFSWIGAMKWIAFGFAALLFMVLAAVTLPIFMGDRTLAIMSGSMEPNIPTGAVVIARPIPSKDIEVGDVIVFSPNPDSQIPVVHRVVKIEVRKGVRYFTTRGDANQSADVDVSLPPTAWGVWGTVPLVGYVISAAASPVGACILIVIPLVLLPLLALFDKIKRHGWMSDLIVSRSYAR